MEITEQIVRFIWLWIWKLDSEAQKQTCVGHCRDHQTQKELSGGVLNNPCDARCSYQRLTIPLINEESITGFVNYVLEDASAFYHSLPSNKAVGDLSFQRWYY